MKKLPESSDPIIVNIGVIFEKSLKKVRLRSTGVPGVEFDLVGSFVKFIRGL